MLRTAKNLSKNSDLVLYNGEVNRLKLKVRKMQNKRKFGQYYQADRK